MKNILVPVGSSKNAVSHLQYAVDFAQAFDAKLYVVQVYNVYTKAGTLIKIDQILERESKEFLEGLVAQLDTKGVEVVTKVLKGKLIDTLELAFNKANIDLLIIEPRTTSEKDEVFLGKTSGRIVKQTEIPALIVPEGSIFKPASSILMALKSAEGDFEVNDELSRLVSTTDKNENDTTFKGVLEYTSTQSPDMLCVVRRQRGFFMKKWEKNTILKQDFYSEIPVLVLSGLK